MNFQNWKTTLSGIVAFLMGVPVLVNAIDAYAKHQNVDWRQVLIGLGLAAAGAIGAFSKDSTTHSTQAQTMAATATVEGLPAAPAMVKAANVQASEKP